jgi:molybdopterin converting factor small subunit
VSRRTAQTAASLTGAGSATAPVVGSGTETPVFPAAGEATRSPASGSAAGMPACSGDAVTRSGGEIEVELFGVPRMVVGHRRLQVCGDSLGAVATALGEACPELLGRVIDAETGWLLSGYTFVVSERFTTDRDQRLESGMTVLLVSSVAGGSGR